MMSSLLFRYFLRLSLSKKLSRLVHDNCIEKNVVKYNTKVLSKDEYLIATISREHKAPVHYLVLLVENNSFRFGKYSIPADKLLNQNEPVICSVTDHKNVLQNVVIRRATYTEFMQLRHWQKLSCCLKPKVLSIIVGLMGISKGDIVLEAGTGAGSATAMFSIAAGKEGQVVSVDVNGKVQKKTRESWEWWRMSYDKSHDIPWPRCVDFYEGDINTCQLKQNFDKAHLDVPNPSLAIKNVAQHLTGGGTLVVFVPSTTRLVALLQLIETERIPLVLEGVWEETQRQWDLHTTKYMNDEAILSMGKPYQNEKTTAFIAKFTKVLWNFNSSNDAEIANGNVKDSNDIKMASGNTNGSSDIKIASENIERTDLINEFAFDKEQENLHLSAKETLDIVNYVEDKTVENQPRTLPEDYNRIVENKYCDPLLGQTSDKNKDHYSLLGKASGDLKLCRGERRLEEGDIVTLTPLVQEARMSRVRTCFCLRSGQRTVDQFGATAHDYLINQLPGTVLNTSLGCEVYVTRASLFECIMSVLNEAKARIAAMVPVLLDITEGDNVLLISQPNDPVSLTLSQAVGKLGHVYTLSSGAEFSNFSMWEKVQNIWISSPANKILSNNIKHVKDLSDLPPLDGIYVHLPSKDWSTLSLVCNLLKTGRQLVTVSYSAGLAQMSLSLLKTQSDQLKFVDIHEDRSRQWTFRKNLISQLDSNDLSNFICRPNNFLNFSSVFIVRMRKQ